MAKGPKLPYFPGKKIEAIQFNDQLLFLVLGHTSLLVVVTKGHSEPEPTSAPWRMNGKWSGNSFLLSSSSLNLNIVVGSVAF
jgi:hypothetical protein